MAPLAAVLVAGALLPSGAVAHSQSVKSKVVTEPRALVKFHCSPSKDGTAPPCAPPGPTTLVDFHVRVPGPGRYLITCQSGMAESGPTGDVAKIRLTLVADDTRIAGSPWTSVEEGHSAALPLEKIRWLTGGKHRLTLYAVAEGYSGTVTSRRSRISVRPL